MGSQLRISEGMSAGELRHWARHCGNGRAAGRAYAIADALDGLSRGEAARLAGMDRQALRDAVTRYNVEGVSGLFDRPKGHRPEWLTEGEQATLAAVIFRGPDPDVDGVCTWTREALAIWISAKFAKTLHPATGDGFALVLPEVNTRTMTLFLAEFAKTLAPDEHAAMVLDGAGWNVSNALVVPDNITFVPMSPYSPESNPVERIWLFLRERFLLLCVWPDRNAIIDAWNALLADTGRIKTLCFQPWVQKVIS